MPRGPAWPPRPPGLRHFGHGVAQGSSQKCGRGGERGAKPSPVWASRRRCGGQGSHGGNDRASCPPGPRGAVWVSGGYEPPAALAGPSRPAARVRVGTWESGASKRRDWFPGWGGERGGGRDGWMDGGSGEASRRKKKSVRASRCQTNGVLFRQEALGGRGAAACELPVPRSPLPVPPAQPCSPQQRGWGGSGERRSPPITAQGSGCYPPGLEGVSIPPARGRHQGASPGGWRRSSPGGVARHAQPLALGARGKAGCVGGSGGPGEPAMRPAPLPPGAGTSGSRETLEG